MSDLRQFRQYLTEKAAVLAANTLLNVHLDYCNSLFTSLFNFKMHKLQCIQNTLGRFVTNCNRCSLGTPILKPLHWLPVEFWCIFKTISFFTVVIQAISALNCLFSLEDMGEHTTTQIKGSCMFLITTHPYTNQISFIFDAPTL